MMPPMESLLCYKDRQTGTTAVLSVSSGKLAIVESFGDGEWLKDKLDWLAENTTGLTEKMVGDSIVVAEHALRPGDANFLTSAASAELARGNFAAVFTPQQAHVWFLSQTLPMDDEGLRETILKSVPNMSESEAAELSRELDTLAKELNRADAEVASKRTEVEEAKKQALEEMKRSLDN